MVLATRWFLPSKEVPPASALFAHCNSAFSHIAKLVEVTVAEIVMRNTQNKKDPIRHDIHRLASIADEQH